MSNTITVDFSNHLFFIDTELDSPDLSPSTANLLNKIKETIKSTPKTLDKDTLDQILSQLNTTQLHLSSTGYTGATVDHIISTIKEYISKTSEVEPQNHDENDLSNSKTQGDSNSKIQLPSTNEISKIVNETIRNSIDEIVSRVNQEVCNKFSQVSRQQHDNYAKVVSETLDVATTDIINQISAISQTLRDNGSNIHQVNTEAQRPTASNIPISQPPVTPASSNVTAETAKTMVEVGKVLQKSAKDIAEQSSYINNISHEISSSITRFKKAFSFKIFISTVLIAWLFAGAGCYFISTYIINKVTKIQQYEQEHEAIQNLKVIKQNLDPDGLKCWNKIFSK